MFQANAFVRTAFASIPSTLFMIALASATPVRADDCQSALSSSTGYTSLSNGSTSNVQRRVDEWEGEVVRLTTDLPGVFTISGSGPRSQSSLFSAAASTPHPRLDAIKLGTGVRSLQAVVRAGKHCIQVAPPMGATGDFTVSVTFTDVCHLGDLDDHGDSFLCSTPLTVGGSSVGGEITYMSSTLDGDMYSFDLSSTTTVTIESTGSTDVNATLYDADGDILDSDDGSGASSNFQIIASSLPADRYYIRVEGAGTTTGSYSVSVDD